MKRVVVVIPTYNEAENIEQVVRQVYLTLPETHLWVVDDGSPDGTAEIAEGLRSQYEGLRIYRREGPRGLGRAYREAFSRLLQEGCYEYIVQMDADLSHDPRYLPDLIQAAEEADVVLGSRYVKGGGVRDWPFHRVLLSRWANFYVHLITGIPVRDATSGFRCWHASALQRLNLEGVVSEGYAFAVEMVFRAYRAGLRIVEVPIVFTDRRHGRSKMTRRVIWESVQMPWRLRFQYGNNGKHPFRKRL
ncbi:MAG TPA: polyprenol monophosphomannose synthase [Chthonomonas sp.]|uniref:polyprenol monophosphomannose synthase n=1 Tax=Chthonomonas sp. TaxID=2282153 RepID=UPI002B4B5038|nr:polyprenol monophosphomannose synthase [Chthonomonas sp.]HLI49305.1 polyprenol monophosphomannose synthase [Chthonomonas sp.]